MSTISILVVEDDESAQELVHNLLTHYDVNVMSVNNVAKAFDALENNHFDMVLTDLHLPGASGWELLSAIQEAGLDTKLACVAITAYHSPETELKALDAGFHGYFAKPIQVRTFYDELISIIQ